MKDTRTQAIVQSQLTSEGKLRISFVFKNRNLSNTNT